MRGFFVLLFNFSLVSAAAAEPALQAESGWIREAPPTAPVRAGYLRLKNEGNTDLTVIGVRSDAFGAIEIHEMVLSSDDTMKMRPVRRLKVPAGGAIALEPGGLHLMLFRPRQTLATGAEVSIVLELEEGGAIEATLRQR